MGSRSRYLAGGALAAGGALVARRRARLRRLDEGIRADVAHAPGHRHVPIVDIDERGPAPLRSRPWTKNVHGMRHPYAGN